MIDTRRLVETPEGVDLHFTPAGPLARAEAWLVDACIRFFLLLVVGVLLAFLGATGAGLYLLMVFAVSWLYFLVFEARTGSTPGKMALKLKVVHDDGTPVGWQAAIVRNLLRAVDVLPVGYAAGLASMLVSRDFRRLGDMAAGTIVIHRESPPPELQLTEVAPQPPPVRLDSAERRAIVDFALRAPTLTPERAFEIANLLPELAAGPNRVRAMQAYAAWIVGRR